MIILAKAYELDEIEHTCSIIGYVALYSMKREAPWDAITSGPLGY